MTTSMTLQLDPVALREATTQAIMGILTPEVRAKIIQDAISAMLRPSTNSWDKGKSPLERAFEDAVANVARETAMAMVRDDQAIKGQIQSLIDAAARKMLTTDVEKLSQRMADAFAESLRRD